MVGTAVGGGFAARREAVAGRLRRVDNRRMDYLRLLFDAICSDEDKVEAGSMLAFSLVIGHHFMAADHGARSHTGVLDLAARWLLAWQRGRRPGLITAAGAASETAPAKIRAGAIVG
jgi:hypothetical protein